MSSYYQKSYRRKFGWRRTVVIVAAVLVAAAGVWLVWQRFFKSPLEQTANNSSVQAIDKSDGEFSTVEGRYLLSGTIVPARGVEQQAAGDYTQPFSKLDTFNPEQYDGWMIDFECPLSNLNLSFREQVDTLTFPCKPAFLPAIKKYFNLINLANNHSGDLGAEAFLTTQQTFDSEGFQVFGNYDPSVSEDACRVVALPVRLQKHDGAGQTDGSLPIAFCAWHYFFRAPAPGEIEVMKEYTTLMPVFAFFHGGAEYQAAAGADQEAIAHKIIELGAEFAIGNNPHWVQNSEVYRNKLVVYSTGNFIFDQLDSETNRGASIDVTLSLDYDDNAAKWLALGDQCRQRINSCLQAAKQQNLHKINPRLTYDVVANISGYRVVTERANDQIQAAVEDRMNWPATLKELAQAD